MNFHVNWTGPRTSNQAAVVTNTPAYSETDQLNTGFWPLPDSGHFRILAASGFWPLTEDS